MPGRRPRPSLWAQHAPGGLAAIPAGLCSGESAATVSATTAGRASSNPMFMRSSLAPAASQICRACSTRSSGIFCDEMTTHLAPVLAMRGQAVDAAHDREAVHAACRLRVGLSSMKPTGLRPDAGFDSISRTAADPPSARAVDERGSARLGVPACAPGRARGRTRGWLSSRRARRSRRSRTARTAHAPMPRATDSSRLIADADSDGRAQALELVDAREAPRALVDAEHRQQDHLHRHQHRQRLDEQGAMARQRPRIELQRGRHVERQADERRCRRRPRRTPGASSGGRRPSAPRRA